MPFISTHRPPTRAVGGETAGHRPKTASTSTSSVGALLPTSPTLDTDALLCHPLVRDLIRENEGMLMELAALREAHAARDVTQQQALVHDESVARGAVSVAEATARAMWAARLHQALVRRVTHLEQLLCEEEAAKEELRNFAEVAQAQLESSVRTTKENAANVRNGVSSSGASPPIKRRRCDDHDGSATDGDADSRRASLEEITNLRGSAKRLRSVESSESGTPRDGRQRLSGAQRSPGALTKVRRTMH